MDICQGELKDKQKTKNKSRAKNFSPDIYLHQDQRTPALSAQQGNGLVENKSINSSTYLAF